MSIQATALVLATILAIYPNVSAEPGLEDPPASTPRWATQRVSTNPKLREHPAVFECGQCDEEEFSWTFSAAEATPPTIELDSGESGRRDASVRM